MVGRQRDAPAGRPPRPRPCSRLRARRRARTSRPASRVGRSARRRAAIAARAPGQSVTLPCAGRTSKSNSSWPESTCHCVSPSCTATSLPTAVMRSPVSGTRSGSVGLQPPQRAQDLARRDLGRLQAVGGAQQHHVLEGEAVFVARAAARRDEAGRDQAGDDRPREAQHLLDAAQRVGLHRGRGHFLARARAGGGGRRGLRPRGAARFAPLRSLASAAGAGCRLGCRARGGGRLLGAEAGAQRLHQVDDLAAGAGSGAADATICLPAIFSSIAARMRCFSSSSNAAGS